jgi:hypothetical protein
MRIKLDDKHWLNCDSQCYWITREVKITKGKGAGSTVERRVSGYTATFAQAVDTFIEKKIKTAEIGDFSELVKIIDEVKNEVAGWKCAVDRK